MTHLGFKFPRKFITTLSAALLFGFALPGCTSSPSIPDIKTVEEKGLGFMAEGKTTREEVLLTLGPANYSYENDRILTYSLWYDEAHGLNPVGRFNTGRHIFLVVVFDERGMLKRHKIKSSEK